MRLATLNPKLTQSTEPPGWHQLTFDCPLCGPPYRIMVHCVIGPPPNRPGVWGLTLPERPSGDGWDGVTLTPSIGNGNHGKRKTCGYHCSITNGEVTP